MIYFDMQIKLVVYLRVSTKGQEVSGLGLEAQQVMVERYAAQISGAIVASYTESESGKKSNRPELVKALAHAKRDEASLVVAKLDRLTRNTKFLLTLLESDVEFVFCDLPSVPPGPVGRFLITQMAAVAELEVGLISERTKAALAATKARGTKLGAARDGFWGRRRAALDAAFGVGRGMGADAQRRKANDFYADIIPLLKGWEREELSFAKMASKLNELGHRTRSGKDFTAMAVWRIMERTWSSTSSTASTSEAESAEQ